MACARYMYDDLLVHSLNEDGTIEESDFVDVLKETIGASDYKVDQYVPLLLDRTYRSVDQSINDGEKYYQCSIHRDVYKERLNALKITIEGCVNGIDDDVDIEREKVAGNLSKLEDNRDEFVRFDVLDEGEVDRVENRLVEYLDDESVEDE
ncbi:hypothetical protein C446_06235 [Halobiforma nitratireducens JCM 10879]|uniref:Uncharacterized protein n=2 Tax=Halobiforma nitratireducens TaxID=130048 RepID=M0M6V9_9EURY|nr:hypothetical protein C446_06235 [Halobiforma nitratireducens JCM 10879]